MPKKTEQKIVKSLPAKERCFVQHVTAAGFTFYTTGKQDRSQYSLWLETEDGYLLIKKAAEPIGFSEIANEWAAEKPKKKRARKTDHS